MQFDNHLLPDDVRIEHVARRTRRAGLSFLTGSASGWGRTKLRSWLIIEYGMATEWTREDETATWLHPHAALSDERAHDVVEDARRRATQMIVNASRTWSSPTFASWMLEAGMIAIVCERSGREAYAPIARSGMTLFDQVASLFVADYLEHPGDYERVQSCDTCGEIPLGGRIRHAKSCVRPPVESGVCLVDTGERKSVRAMSWPPPSVRMVAR